MKTFIVVIFMSLLVHSDTEKKIGHFSGRVSKLNPKASLLRVKVDFDNFKYLNKGDVVYFWSGQNGQNRCMSFVEGKTNNYLLIRVPNFEKCVYKVSISTGAYIRFYSNDLSENINQGIDLIEILLKKRAALEARRTKLQRDLDTHIEKVSAINSRYEVLREKLELEWKKELKDLESDKSKSLRSFKNVEILLHDVDYKLEQYKVSEKNLELEKWSLDPKLYYSK